MARIIERTAYTGPAVPEQLRGTAFMEEVGADTFEISDLPFVPSGVLAHVLRSDDVAIAVDGTYTDGKAVVTLVADCYHVAGRLSVAVYITDAGGASQCVYACVGNVYRTIGGTELDSGTEIPTLAQLEAAYNACIEGAAAAQAAAASADARVLGTVEDEADIDVTDTEGNVILRLADGHIQTKEFDSAEVPTAQDIEDLHDEIEEVGQVIGYETGKNLVDPSKLTTGYIQSNGSLSTSGSYGNYSTSDFVELEANTDYAFAGFGASSHSMLDYNRVACLLFDADKAPISGTYQDYSSSQAGGKLTFNSGSTAKYARVTTKTDALFQLEKGTAVPTTYEEYSGRDVLVYPLGHTPLSQSQRGNVLYGKKWAVCGDSFTDGATSTKITDDGIYKGYSYVYPYLIGNRNDMKIVRFFNGGQTLAFPAEPGTFTNSLTYASGPRYYQNIPADADYITIYLGINDANHASGSSIDGESTEGVIPLGEITDNTTATYYGAWNVVLTWLITNRPNAHIGIIVTNGNATNDNYRLAQIAIAKKYGIPYIDMNGDARTPAMLRTSNPDIAAAVKTALIEKWRVSSTNTHPNDAAHLFESAFIEEFLRTI